MFSEYVHACVHRACGMYVRMYMLMQADTEENKCMCMLMHVYIHMHMCSEHLASSTPQLHSPLMQSMTPLNSDGSTLRSIAQTQVSRGAIPSPLGVGPSQRFCQSMSSRIGRASALLRALTATRLEGSPSSAPETMTVSLKATAGGWDKRAQSEAPAVVRYSRLLQVASSDYRAPLTSWLPATVAYRPVGGETLI